MVAPTLQRALLFALPLAGLSSAQTILSPDGKVLVANETTVAPAAEVVADAGPEALQLTDAVIANLTALKLSGAEYFQFGDEAPSYEEKRSGQCKTFPGDAAWPSRLTWKVVDLLTGGVLIDTVPIGAVCYPDHGVYDAARCQEVLDNWGQSWLHAADPTSVMSPLYQGETCMPQKGNSSTCTLGGYPSFALRVSNVAQIQLAVNFARNLKLRLVVKNTGHDFLGKSAGAGALSIWTHHLKSITHIPSYTTPSYSGPALKLGAGVQVGEMYAAANSFNLTAVGGECKGVGVAGGYLAGGGHSPMSSKLGLGSDQVLSIDVVLPSGRFTTVSETQNPDLFWALRGGGGGTFGVVTSVTVKAHPRMTFSGLTFTVLSGPAGQISDSVFWAAMKAYWRHFPKFADAGSYGYSTVFPLGAPGSGYVWSMLPWMIPGMELADFQALVAPMLAEWAALGLNVAPEYFTYDNFYEAWSNHFPTESIGISTMRTCSRLFPRANWDEETRLETMLEEVRRVVDEGSAIIQYNMNPSAPAGTPASAANSHWRDALWFAIMGAGWAEGTTGGELEAVNRKITDDWMGRLREYGPGAYGNEGDVMEPDFGEAFFGENYARLLQIKRAVDPTDLFWAPTAVGSERWKVEGQEEWLTKQTGRLCRV